MIRPTSNYVLVAPKAPELRTKGGIHLVESNRWSTDVWEHVVIACGVKVPFDIQPGARVLLDPTSLRVREFDHEGQKLRLVPWREVQMIVGVASE